MKFGLEKCAMLLMKSWKRETTEGIELLNQERILREGKWQVLGNIGHQTGAKLKKKKKKYFWKFFEIALQQKSHERDKYLGNSLCKCILDHS